MTEIRYGIIGTGMMGVEHLYNLQALPGARVSALCDPNADSLATAAALEPTASRYRDLDSLLASDDCDAYVVATPNQTHVDVLGRVLQTGLPLLIEKPLCTTVEDCQKVLDAARDYPTPIWMGLEYRYMAPVARLIAEVRAGAVGPVRMVAIREHRFPFLEKVDNWNRLSRNTGGTLVEKCCHFFDLMSLIVDDEPVRVYATGGQAVNHLDEVYNGERSDLLDHASVTVDYAGGQVATLDLCMFAEATHSQEEVSVIGNLGKVEAHLPDGVFRLGLRGIHTMGDVQHEIVESSAPYAGEHHGSSFVEHQHFLRTIQEGTTPEVTLADGLLSVAVGVAAHRSIETGLPVAMSEVLSQTVLP
jgi:predicted dehydrogenase